jgi:phytoene dehydrogenase-like protein
MAARIEQQIERFAPGFRDCILAPHIMTLALLEPHNANLVGGDINGGRAHGICGCFAAHAALNQLW